MILRVVRLMPALALAAWVGASAVHADPITIGSAQDSVFGAGATNVDINSDGVYETEYSRIYQQFTRNSVAGATMKITFNYMFLTSEGNGSPDVFRIGVRTLDGTFVGTTGTGNPLLGTVVAPGSSYTGLGDQYDFVNNTVNGSAVTAIDQPLVAPDGGKGFEVPAGLLDGAIGWRTAAFTFGAGNPGDQLIFEALVADGGDGLIESVLLIDNVVLTKSAARGSTPAANGGNIVNGSFEDFTAVSDGQGGLKNWLSDGNSGIYFGGAQPLPNGGSSNGAKAITDANGNQVIEANAGNYYAAIGTQNQGQTPVVAIPEPASIAGFAAGLFVLASARRRRD